MKKLLALVVAICVAAVLFGFGPATNFKFTKTYKYDSGTWGDDSVINFNHRAHVDRQGRECSTCHDGFIDPNGGYVSRAADLYNGSTINSGHTICKDCHNAEGATEVCTDCHNNAMEP